MRYLGGNTALSGLVLGVLLVCAGAPAAADEAASPLGPDSIKVAGSDIHEDCRGLQAGEALTYSFEASKPLDFNIHFHDAGLVYTPVELSGVEAHQGRFEAEIAQTYCLMWTSLSLEDTWLRYQVE